MTHQHTEISPISYARIAGLLYLIIAVVGGFSIGYIPSQIVVDGDAATVANTLMEHRGLYRMGILGDTIVIIAEILLTAMLYVMFRPVSPTLSMIAALARLSMIVVMAVNLLIYVLPLMLSGVLETGAWQDLSLTALKAHQLGIYIWGILFGLHLVALGYVVAVSGYCPRILGWMMMLGSFGYSLEGIAKITATESGVLSVVTIGLLVIVTFGELAFALWLLVKGVRQT